MNNSDQETTREAILYEKYFEYTNEQILEILRSHKDYQEVAVDVVVKIAVDRNLINSKQDLLSPEFQKSRSTKRTLYPEINNDFHRKRLIGSILRFMYLVSILPLTYGILSYAKGEIVQTMLGVGIALIWFLLCLFLKKTQNVFVFIPLFILLFGVSVMTGYSIFKRETFHIIDFVILVVGTLLPLYLMLYLKNLIQKS